MFDLNEKEQYGDYNSNVRLVNYITIFEQWLYNNKVEPNKKYSFFLKRLNIINNGELTNYEYNFYIHNETNKCKLIIKDNETKLDIVIELGIGEDGLEGFVYFGGLKYFPVKICYEPYYKMDEFQFETRYKPELSVDDVNNYSMKEWHNMFKILKFFYNDFFSSRNTGDGFNIGNVFFRYLGVIFNRVGIN